MAFQANYDPTLKYVTSIGKWNKGDKSGHLRFITHSIGSEHIRNTLYIQWLTYHIDGVTKSEIIDEKEITELRGYEYTTPKCESAVKCDSFKLEATESFGHYKRFIFTIKSSGVGNYTITKKPL